MRGGCYCGALRYDISMDAVFKGQCHCRACQHVSGGGPNYFMVIPEAGFTYTSGTPKTFARTDLEKPVTREFCAECGTHILTRRQRFPMAIVKVGTLDDPAAFGGPESAIYLQDKQPFHLVPGDIPCFEESVPR